MNYFDIVNGSLLYIMVSVVIAFVFGLSLYFARKAWKKALELGYTKQDLTKVIKSTIGATIVPSIAIVIGLFTLITSLGIPFPWLRLSVIGSVSYELIVSESATAALVGDGLALSEVPLENLTAVMLVMSISITGGLFTLLFFGKKIQSKINDLSENKKGFGFVAVECLLIALAATFLPAFLVKDWASFLTFMTSLVITVSFGLLSMKVAKLSWLKDFILALALLGGMASSIIWIELFKVVS